MNKGLSAMNFIRLQDARLCSDCEAIYDEEVHKLCPKCASGTSLKVSRIIPLMEEKI